MLSSWAHRPSAQQMSDWGLFQFQRHPQGSQGSRASVGITHMQGQLFKRLLIIHKCMYKTHKLNSAKNKTTVTELPSVTQGESKHRIQPETKQIYVYKHKSTHPLQLMDIQTVQSMVLSTWLIWLGSGVWVSCLEYSVPLGDLTLCRTSTHSWHTDTGPRGGDSCLTGKAGSLAGYSRQVNWAWVSTVG